jgi:peptide/nickel transport system substrate-binding protein
MKKAYKGTICILISAALLFGLLSGCGSFSLPSASPAGQTTPVTTAYQKGSGDNIFSINYSSKYGINPFSGQNKVNQLVSSLVYESLFVLDLDYAFQPLLCESWTTEGGLSFKFNIKSGVSFHDGIPLTAYDVAFSLNQAKKSGIYIERLSKITNISALDAKTVSVSLSKADMLLPALLDIPIIKSGEINLRNPVGSGPYSLLSDSGGSYLKAYEGWREFKSLPVQRIYLQEYTTENIISAFEGNYLDLVFSDPLDLSSVNIKGSSDVYYFDTTNLHYLAFNMQSAAFSNSEIRRAVGYAVNREYIAGNLMSYAASVAYLPTLMMKEQLGQIRNQYSYSPDTAKSIMSASGIEDINKDGLLEYKSGGLFTIKFIANKDNPYKLAAAKEIAASLVKIGVSVDFRQLSWEEYLAALRNGDFDMYYAETKLPADFDISALVSGGNLNFGRINDSAYGVLMNAYLAADDNSRLAAAQALYSDIAKTAPIIPVVFRRQAIVAKRGVISGALPSQSNVFKGIEKWKISLS